MAMGFTLIELLVVIAIISVLMSILLPGLRRAKVKATIATCSGRMHDASVGMISFVNDSERLPDVLNIYQRAPEWSAWDHFDEYIGTSKSLTWLYPCGAGVSNAWLTATVDHWCAPVRNSAPTDCLNNPQNQVHVGCHISRRIPQIKGEWQTRYPLLCCYTLFDVNNLPNCRSEHLNGPAADGTNIAFLDGRVEWRPIRAPLFAPHPTVLYMLRDQGDWKTSAGLWVFGYGSYSILLPQEIHGTHPDQTNMINQATSWPDCTVRPYWMR